MTTVGNIEFKAQRCGIALFRDRLGYEYLGDWQDWEDKVRVYRRPLGVWNRREEPEWAVTTIRSFIRAVASNPTLDSSGEHWRAAAGLAPERPIRRESGRRTLKSTDHKYLQTRWKLWGRVAGLQWIRLSPVGYGRAGEWTSSRGRETGEAVSPA